MVEWGFPHMFKAVQFTDFGKVQQAGLALNADNMGSTPILYMVT